MRPERCAAGVGVGRAAGLTLIELLTSLAIVGILASIACVGYAGYAERTRVHEAVTEIGQIELAIAVFATRPDRLAGGGLPEDLSELGIDAALMTDPWGRPYQYRRDDARLNRDYDLFSLGKDGATDSAVGNPRALDDIVRGAAGSFIGTGADYAAITGADTHGFSTDASARDGGPSSGSPGGKSRFVR